ncbi:MAG: hypothetical protein KAI66_24065, partial [Lentisphaeria bacterium]|nr:hypothetical protein [Lentisphaeria bacterium]
RFEQKHFKRPVATACGSDADCPHYVCDPKQHVCQAPLSDVVCDENTPCPNFQCVEDRQGDHFCEYPVAVACLEGNDCPPYPVSQLTGLCTDPAGTPPLEGVCPKRECVSQYLVCVDNTTCPGYNDTSPETNPECLDGYCRQPCANASECNPGESCDPDPLSEYQPCGSNTDCADPGQVCRDGVCRRPCFSGADCPGAAETCEDALCTWHHCVDHSGGTCSLMPCTTEVDCPILPCDPEVGRCLVQPCLDSRDCEHQHCELVLGSCMGPPCVEDVDCRGERGFTCNEAVGDPCDRDIDCPFDFCTVEVKRCAIDGLDCESNFDCVPNLCTNMCDDPDVQGDQDPCCSFSNSNNPEFCSTDEDCSFNFCETVHVCANDERIVCTMSLDCPQNFCKADTATAGDYDGTCLNDPSITCDIRTANVDETCQVGMCSRNDNLGTCDTLAGEPCTLQADCPPYRCNMAIDIPRCYYPVDVVCWYGAPGGCGPDYVECPSCPEGLDCLPDDGGSNWGFCGKVCNSDTDCPPALCKGRCVPQREEDRLRCTDWFDPDRDCLLFDSDHSGEVPVEEEPVSEETDP